MKDKTEKKIKNLESDLTKFKSCCDLCYYQALEELEKIKIRKESEIKANDFFEKKRQKQKKPKW